MGTWLVFGDIHDDLGSLNKIPELASADGIIVSGDITNGGGVKQAERSISPLMEASPLIYAQVGNMDRPLVTDWLKDKGINLHGEARELYPGIIVIGLGCSPFTPFGTPSEYPESKLGEWLNDSLQEAQNIISSAQKGVYDKEMSLYTRPRLILISHTPPYNTLCDKIHDGTSVGSKAVREFIEERQPDVCICGHIHEAVGEDYIGKTHILNPGTLGSGGYVVLSFNNSSGSLEVSAELKNIFSSN